MSGLARCVLVIAGESYVKNVGIGGVKRKVRHHAGRNGISRVQVDPGPSRAPATYGGDPQLAAVRPECVSLATSIRGRKSYRGDRAVHLGSVERPRWRKG